MLLRHLVLTDYCKNKIKVFGSNHFNKRTSLGFKGNESDADEPNFGGNLKPFLDDNKSIKYLYKSF